MVRCRGRNQKILGFESRSWWAPIVNMSSSLETSLTMRWSVATARLTMRWSVATHRLTMRWSVATAWLTMRWSVATAWLTMRWSVATHRLLFALLLADFAFLPIPRFNDILIRVKGIESLLSSPLLCLVSGRSKAIPSLSSVHSFINSL